MMLFKDITFECPQCHKQHNLRDFLEKNLEQKKTSLDTEFIEENLFEDGRCRLSYPYCECDCGQQFLIDIENGFYVIIYNDNNDLVDQIEYNI